MAITVGTPTAVYSEDDAITIDKPTGAVDGTLLIAAIFTDNGSFSELSAPAGWTLETDGSHNTGFSSGGQLKIFTRIVNGDGANYTFDHRDGASTSCSIVPVFGAGPTPALSFTKDAATTTETAPAGTAASTTDALLCWMCVTHESGAMGVYTPPAGMTEIVEISGLWSSHSVAKLEAIGSVGSTGTKDFGLSGASKRSGTPEVGVTLVIADPGGGGTTVTGAAVGSFGFTASVAGVDRALGAAATTFTLTATVTGTRRTPGQASGSFGFTGAATGQARTPGTANGSFGWTGTANGLRRVTATATASFGFTATASGAGQASVTGQAAADFGWTGAAAGTSRTLATATTTFGGSYAATGTTRKLGHVAAAIGYTATATGLRRPLGTAAALLGFTATISGGDPASPDPNPVTLTLRTSGTRATGTTPQTRATVTARGTRATAREAS